jgi:hypothetical protein
MSTVGLPLLDAPRRHATRLTAIPLASVARTADPEWDAAVGGVAAQLDERDGAKDFHGEHRNGA